MGAAVQAEKAKTELAKANELVKAILKEVAKEKKIRDAKKSMMVELQEIVDRNRSRWMIGTKSFRMDAGMVKYSAKSKAVVGKKFSLDEFMTHYSSLFRFKAEHNIQAGDLRTFMNDPEHAGKLKMLDISLESVEVFSVES